MLNELAHYAYSPDGSRLWGIEDDTKIRCWASPGMQPMLEVRNPLTGLEHGDDVLWAIACGSDVVLVGARHGELFAFSARDGSLQKSVLLPNSSVRTVALAPSGKMAVAGTDQGGLFLVSIPEGQILGQLPAHSAGVRTVLFSRDGKLLLSGSQDRSVRLWGRSGASFVELFRIDKLPGPVKAVRLSDDKFRLAVLLEDERGVRIWKLDQLNQRFRKQNAAVAELGDDDRIDNHHSESDGDTLEGRARIALDQHRMEEGKQVGITAVLNDEKYLQILGTQRADTIEVRQYYGQLVVPGVMIQVDGSLRSSVPESRVDEIHVWGYDGDDTIKIFDSSDGPPYQDIEHTARIWGGRGNDVLIGGYCNDNLYGEGGQDTLDGRCGNDWLSGGGEDDKLTGGPHQDWLLGDDGHDVLTDDAGNELAVEDIEERK
jgi:hypothetical protein